MSLELCDLCDLDVISDIVCFLNENVRHIKLLYYHSQMAKSIFSASYSSKDQILVVFVCACVRACVFE